MKKIILYFIVMVLCKFGQCQVPSKNDIKGSWINLSITEYYESNKQHACDINYFDNDKFIPLYLSFENKDQVKITNRIEQTIFTYKVNYTKPDSIFIYRGENIYSIYVLKDTLKLMHNQNVISFKKVSDNYSTDVFGEYIKGVIFKKHENYLNSSFKESHVYNNILISRANFKDKIMEIFKCDHVDFVQLGSFKFKNTCLPEIALYYDNSKKRERPRVIGILIENDEINFIDESGINVLIIKSN
ncbi:MAG: hypothetical protein PHT07_20625 [Paludibacter sp.]|nr:hypothetical protein [Paludibacter sp.]